MSVQDPEIDRRGVEDYFDNHGLFPIDEGSYTSEKSDGVYKYHWWEFDRTSDLGTIRELSMEYESLSCQKIVDDEGALRLSLEELVKENKEQYAGDYSLGITEDTDDEWDTSGGAGDDPYAF